MKLTSISACSFHVFIPYVHMRKRKWCHVSLLLQRTYCEGMQGLVCHIHEAHSYRFTMANMYCAFCGLQIQGFGCVVDEPKQPTLGERKGRLKPVIDTF